MFPNKIKGKRPVLSGNGSQRVPKEISPKPAVEVSFKLSVFATRGNEAVKVKLSSIPYCTVKCIGQGVAGIFLYA